MKISLKIGVACTDEKMRENHLRWFDYVQRIVINAPMRKCELIQDKVTRKGREDLK